jgi:hypothetical protein
MRSVFSAADHLPLIDSQPAHEVDHGRNLIRTLGGHQHGQKAAA